MTSASLAPADPPPPVAAALSRIAAAHPAGADGACVTCGVPQPCLPPGDTDALRAAAVAAGWWIPALLGPRPATGGDLPTGH